MNGGDVVCCLTCAIRYTDVWVLIKYYARIHMHTQCTTGPGSGKRSKDNKGGSRISPVSILHRYMTNSIMSNAHCILVFTAVYVCLLHLLLYSL
jgi:hypothetical protein